MKTLSILKAATAIAIVAAPAIATAEMTKGYLESAPQGAWTANNLVGQTVYNSIDENSDAIGDINNLIISRDGEVSGVIIGVGGFLGAGEKNVAVSFDDLVATKTANEERRIILTTSKAELESAPEFQSPQTILDSAAAALGRENQELRVVEPAELEASEFVGSRVYTAEHEWIGEVGDVLMTPSGEMEAVVVEYGGWFGIGEKDVAVSMSDIEFRTDPESDSGDYYVYLKTSKEALEAAPEYTESAAMSDTDTAPTPSN